MSDSFIGRCPSCGYTLGLAELKRMAVGDGWQRYLAVESDRGERVVVSFDEYNPTTMCLWRPGAKVEASQFAYEGLRREEIQACAVVARIACAGVPLVASWIDVRAWEDAFC